MQSVKIDAHQHFWNYDPVDYPWMDGEDRSVLRRDYGPEDLQTLQEPLGWAGSIAVQARQSLEETRWLLRLADQYPRIRGVVGWVDLRSPEVEAQLDEFAGHPRCVGMRHVVQDEPDDEFMLGEAFQRGISKLASRGLRYDILIYPRQMMAALELVKQFPAQAFVVDHLAKPAVPMGLDRTWVSRIRALAGFENVCCKLSGLVTEAAWHQWTPDQLRPFLEVCAEAFGEDRIMVGSDWPVCLLAARDYAEVMGVMEDFVEQWSQSARDKILGGNACRFYGIEAGE